MCGVIQARAMCDLLWWCFFTAEILSLAGYSSQVLDILNQLNHTFRHENGFRSDKNASPVYITGSLASSLP